MAGEITESEQPLVDLAFLEASGINPDTVESVPEHHIDITAMVERYGDDPSKCPFLNSMGAKGIELYQRLKQNEVNPERGPTMRELLEASKQRQTPEEKPVVHAQPVAAESEEVYSRIARLADTTATAKKIDNRVEQEAAVRNEEVLLEILNLKSEEPDKPIKVRALDTSVVERAAASTDLKPQKSKEIKKIDQEVITQVPVKKPTAQLKQSAPIASPTHTPKKKTVSSPKAPLKPVLSVKTKIEKPEPEIVATAAPANEKVYPVAFIKKQPEDKAVFDYAPYLEELISIVEPVPSPTESSELDQLTDLNETAETANYIFEKPPAGEAVTFMELEEQIITYSELLSYKETEEPQLYLSKLVELVDSFKEEMDISPEIQAEFTEQVEQVLVLLLESIKLDLDEQTIKAIVANLVGLESRAIKQSANNLSIEQLNILGTREYKANTMQPIFTNLLQSLKDKLKARLSIGKYALVASSK